MNDPNLSIKDVAALCSVSVSTVRRLIKRGVLKPYRIGNQWRFDKEEIERSLRQGGLSFGNEKEGEMDESSKEKPPEWAQSLIERWQIFLMQQIRQVKPDHVILLDRRGAKIWSEYLKPKDFVQGENLWHSNALDCMTQNELRDLCNQRSIMIFDEMMRHGRQLADRKDYLVRLGASVQSVVLIRARSYFEDEKLIDRDAIYCEDLNDNDFSVRALHISSLLERSTRPLDVDHLVMEGQCRLVPEDLLARLSQWGLPYVVWVPGSEDGPRLLALALDRPQFFDTGGQNNGSNLKREWNGPCKLRLYLKPHASKTCYCSFIAFPTLSGSDEDWSRSYARINADRMASVGQEEDFARSVYESNPEQARACVAGHEFARFALRMFEDFVYSRAAESLQIEFKNPTIEQQEELKATFGPSLGNSLSQRVIEIVAASGSKDMPIQRPKLPPPERITIRKRKIASFDEISCRKDLLSLDIIPHRHPDSGEGETKDPVRFDKIYGSLETYAESTIAKILDHELDRGTAKPMNFSPKPEKTSEKSQVEFFRGYCRGEFDVYSGQGKVLTETDNMFKKTLGVCFEAIDAFAQIYGQEMTPTQFSTVFVNLYHDFADPKREGRKPAPEEKFFLTWVPDEFGCPKPVAAVDKEKPELSLSDFLESQKYVELSENGISIAPALKDFSLTGYPKTSVGTLVRFYCAIEKGDLGASFHIQDSGGELINPLFVLASARNARTCYICCRKSVETWQYYGNSLFQLSIRSDAVEKILTRLTQPAQWISYYLEAYRVLLPKIRDGLLSLKRSQPEYDVAQTILASMDLPESADDHDLLKVDNAKDVMGSFASLTRAVLDAGPKNTITHEIRVLVEKCPEPGLKNALAQAADVSRGDSLRIRSLEQSFRIIADWLSGLLPIDKPPEWIKLIKQGEIQEKLRGIQSNHGSDCYALVAGACHKLYDKFSCSEDKIAYPMREICGTVKNRLGAEQEFYGPLEAQGMLLFAGTDPEKTLVAIEKLNRDFLMRLKDSYTKTYYLPAWVVGWHDTESIWDLKVVQLPEYVYESDIVVITQEVYDKLQKSQSKFEEWIEKKPIGFGKLYRLRGVSNARPTAR